MAELGFAGDLQDSHWFEFAGVYPLRVRPADSHPLVACDTIAWAALPDRRAPRITIEYEVDYILEPGGGALVIQPSARPSGDGSVGIRGSPPSSVQKHPVIVVSTLAAMPLGPHQEYLSNEL